MLSSVAQWIVDRKRTRKNTPPDIDTFLDLIDITYVRRNGPYIDKLNTNKLDVCKKQVLFLRGENHSEHGRHSIEKNIRYYIRYLQSKLHEL